MDDGTVSAAPSHAFDQGAFGIGIGNGGGSGLPVRSARKALLAIAIVLVVVAVPVTSVVILSPSAAEQVQAFGGTVVINNTSGDTSQAVEMDLASGKPSLGLNYAYDDVSASSVNDLDVLPLSSGSLFLNTRNGSVNFLDVGNVLVDQTQTSGLPVPGQPSEGAAWAIPDGSGAYVVRSGPVTTISEVLPGDLEGRSVRIPSTELKAVAAENADGQVPAAVAGGNLWIRTGTPSDGSRLDIDELMHASYGTTRLAVRRNTASCMFPCQLDTGGSGTSSEFVALASRNSIGVVSASGSLATTSILGNVESITAVGDSGSDALFVVQTRSGGWELIGVTSGGSTTIPVPLKNLSASALLQPTMDDGVVYTIAEDRSGTLSLLSVDTTTGAVTTIGPYPTDPDGQLDRQTDQVVAVGPRVIFNDPSMISGVTVFTDGSHPPLTFRKTGLFGRDPSQSPGGTAAKKVVPKSVAPTPVHQADKTPPTDNESPCSGSGLTAGPHQPETLTKVSVSPHSTTVSWVYPLEALSDCIPQSWIISATPTGGSGAGSSPVLDAFDNPLAGTGASVAGQTTVAGLQSGTTYSLAIAAQLNGKTSSASEPITVSTPVSGPDAPTITGSVGSDGKWTVNWLPCSGNCPDNEPVKHWYVSWSECTASSGIVAGVSGSATVGALQRTYSLPVSVATPAGTSLSFQVRGDGTVDGDPSRAGDCVTAWGPGNLATLKLVPTLADPGSATLPVTIGASIAPSTPSEAQVDAVSAFGYTAGQVEFSLQVPGATDLPSQQPMQSVSWTVGGPLPQVTFANVERVPGIYMVTAELVIAPSGGNEIVQGTLTSAPENVYDPSIDSTIVSIPQSTVGQTTSVDLGPDATGGSSGSYTWALAPGSIPPASVVDFNLDPSGTVTFTATSPFPDSAPLNLSFTVSSGGVISTSAQFSFTALLQPLLSATAPSTVIESGSGISVPSGNQTPQGSIIVTATLSIPLSDQPGAWSPAIANLAVSAGSTSASCPPWSQTSGSQSASWTAKCTLNTGAFTLGPLTIAASYSMDDYALSASWSTNLTVFGPSSTPLAPCTVGVSCNDSLDATAGQDATITWKLVTTSQNADGLSIGICNNNSCLLSGKPTTAESVSLEFEVSDGMGDTFDYSTSVTVNPSTNTGGGGGTGNSGGGGTTTTTTTSASVSAPAFQPVNLTGWDRSNSLSIPRSL